MKLNKTLSSKASEDAFKQLSPPTKHKILMANDLDTKLYAYAKELFESRLAQWRQTHVKPPTSVEKKLEAETEAAQEKKSPEEESKAVTETEEEVDEEEEEEEVNKESEKIAVKEEEEEEDEGEEDEEGDDEEEESKSDNKTPPTPKPATTSGNIKTSESSAKGTSGTSKAATDGKESKEDDDKESKDAKPSASDTGKSGTGASSKPSGASSASTAGSVKPMSDDVNAFFSQLAEAKGSEKDQKGSSGGSGSTATKSSGGSGTAATKSSGQGGSTATKSSGGPGSGSGAGQNPSLGEKFRQLQGHPTHKPDIIQKDQEEEENEEEKGKGNSAVVDKAAQARNQPQKEQEAKPLAQKEEKEKLVEKTKEQSQNDTGNLTEQPRKEGNASRNGALVSNIFIDPFSPATNLSTDGTADFVDQAAINLTSSNNIDRLSSGLGQILTANEPEYRFDLAPSDVKLGQTSSLGMGSSTGAVLDLPGTKKESDLGKSGAGKGFGMDEFNFGEGETLGDSKDGLTMGDTAAKSDLLANKIGIDNLDSTGTLLNANLDAKSSEMGTDKITKSSEFLSEEKVGQTGIFGGGINAAGTDFKQGAASDDFNAEKDFLGTGAGDLGSPKDLQWGEKTIPEAVSPLEPEIKMDETLSSTETGAGGLGSKQVVGSGELAAGGGLSASEDGAQQSSVNFGGKSTAVDSGIDGFNFGTESSLEGADLSEKGQSLPDGSLKSTALESLAAEGFEMDQFKDQGNLENMEDSDPMLVSALDARMQGRGGSRANVFSVQRQRGFVDFGPSQDLDQSDFEIDQQFMGHGSNSPTARFRINPRRASNPGVGEFNYYGEPPMRGRMGRGTLPGRPSRRRRRSSRRIRYPNYVPLTEEGKQVRSMFV